MNWLCYIKHWTVFADAWHPNCQYELINILGDINLYLGLRSILWSMLWYIDIARLLPWVNSDGLSTVLLNDVLAKWCACQVMCLSSDVLVKLYTCQAMWKCMGWRAKSGFVWSIGMLTEVKCVVSYIAASMILLPWWFHDTRLNRPLGWTHQGSAFLVPHGFAIALEYKPEFI